MKILPCLLALLALMVAACGDDDDATGESQPPAGETATSVEPTQSPAEPADADDASEPARLIDGEARGLYLYDPESAVLEPIAGADALGQRGVGLDWFPDGNALAAFGANLLRVDVSGGTEVIYEPEDLVFGTQVSPDGNRIAFSCSGPASSDVCIVPAEAGGQLTRASEDEYFDYLIGWLDDERILILSDGRPGAPDIPVYEAHFPDFAGYFVLNTTDGNIVPATADDVSDPWLSPDGEWTFEIGAAPTYVFFSRTTGANIDVPVEPEDIEAVDPTALADQFQVAWSSNASAALVQRVIREEAGFIRSAYNVWLVDLSEPYGVQLIVSTEPCQTDLDCVVSVDWAPDSSSLAILFGIAGD